MECDDFTGHTSPSPLHALLLNRPHRYDLPIISADVCDEVADILDLDNILPLGGVDTTIELDPLVTTLECPKNDDEDELLDEIVVSGGQLTISSNSTVR